MHLERDRLTVERISAFPVTQATRETIPFTLLELDVGIDQFVTQSSPDNLVAIELA